MKELMKTNVYDVGESVLIVGSCLPDMEPEGFAQLCASSGHVFELCLEQTHINMAITKISAMLYTGKIRTLRFATVDRSPHCVQMHYIQNELRRMMDLSAVTIENYIVENGKLTKLSPELIYLSKHLGERKCIRNPQDRNLPILRSNFLIGVHGDDAGAEHLTEDRRADRRAAAALLDHDDEGEGIVAVLQEACKDSVGSLPTAVFRRAGLSACV